MTHFRTCTLCEAMCGIEVEATNGVVTRIRGDQSDPFSRGHVCPKAVALGDLQSDPDRLERPLLRADGKLREIGWDEAFDRAADGIRRVQRAHGKSGVAVYLGNPTVHNYGSLLYAPPFVRALHTKNRFSATSVDQLPHMLAAYWMFGHQLLLPVPDVNRTEYFLIFGANPLASNGSLMTAPGIERRLRAIQKRGGKLVVLDPRRTETAKLADEHHFIRPGSDAWLLLALLHVVFEEGLTRPSPLAGDLAPVRALVKRFSPERAEAQCGVAANDMRRIARDYATARRAVCYGRMGVSTQEFGTLCAWLMNLLNLVTGRLDAVGGAMFAEPAVDLVASPKLTGRGSFGRWKSRVRGLPEFGGELPVAALAEDIEAGAIHALVTSAGNPVLSTPQGTKLDRALSQLDFMVSIDFYLNETTRHANVILPPTPPLSHDHYDLAFHVLAVENTAKYSPALFERPPHARHDWEIFCELGARLESRAKWRAMKALGPRRLLDIALRSGPYGAGFVPGRRGLSLSELERRPHGVWLGALSPCLAKRICTESGRVEVTPRPLLADLERLEATVARPGLTLVGRRHLRSNNSWMHNSQRLIKGPERCTLLMHPEDAKARGVTNESRVRLSSEAGSVVVSVELSDEMMRGVVSLPHGFGHDRPGIRLRIASGHAGASINDVTDASRLDAASGNAAFSGTPVTVELL
ncbi:MAG: molybdopterin-dependent oxidoreductase [Polyangiaceae bacterium]|nr:molybdopterin-dependent oxidoreductase [Polyangiaceae bacterium]